MRMAIESSERMAITKWLQTFFRNVSAEPAVFVYSLVVFLYVAAMPNLIQQKVCSPKIRPPVDFVCNDMTLLAEATDVVTVRGTLKQSLPAIILLLAGFWRDNTGLNKPIVYFAIFWEIVGICIQIYSYLNWKSSPWITSISEGIINGLGGGSSLFFVGATCAITDNTKPEDRTSRLTFVFAEVAIGACLAYGISGFCQTYMGYTWFLLFIMSLQVASGALIMVFVKDKEKREKKSGIYELLKQLKSAFNGRPNATVVWFMVIASCSITVLTQAESNVYQYYLQQTFGYTIEQVGLYTGYRLMVGSVGSMIVTPILIKVIKLSDFNIGIGCSLITAVSSISMVFATTSLEIILFALLDLTKIILFGVPKSIISKCVHEDEMGMFISYCLIGESILPIVIYYPYDYIYTATSTSLPGAFYLASTAILIILLIFYSVSRCIYTSLEICEEDNKNVPEDEENGGKVLNVPEITSL